MHSGPRQPAAVSVARALLAVAAVVHGPAEAGEEIEKRPAPVDEHLFFVGGFAEVRGPGHRVLPGAIAREAVEFGRGGVGRVRAETGAAAPFVRAMAVRHFLEEKQRARDEFFRGDDPAHVDHLVEPPRPQRRRGHLPHEFGEGLDVEDRGRAPAGGFGEPARDGGEVIFLVERALEGVDAADPFGEIPRRQDGVAQRGIIEVTMRVDEAGQQADLAQVGDGFAGEVAAQFRPRSGGGDEFVAHEDRAVRDGRAVAVHGDEVAGAEDHGWCERVATDAGGVCLDCPGQLAGARMRGIILSPAAGLPFTTARASATSRLHASWQSSGMNSRRPPPVWSCAGSYFSGGSCVEGTPPAASRRQRIVRRQPPSERQNRPTSVSACASVSFCVTRYMPVCRARVSRNGVVTSRPRSNNRHAPSRAG